uniref:Ig-like domain-containing protein n=1 Tax=Panagrolaimus sp. ES5 TaxID=591445 RepID=A0AC34FMC4_9BILA
MVIYYLYYYRLDISELYPSTFFPIKAEAKLKVLVESSLPPGFPEIEAHPVLKSVEQGRTAYVTCKVKGDPRPRVLWLRDMMPIDIRSNSRYSVSTLGNPGALMIQQAREDDQGKYECVARNEHGVVHSKAAHIYVKGLFTFKHILKIARRLLTIFVDPLKQL